MGQAGRSAYSNRQKEAGRRVTGAARAFSFHDREGSTKAQERGGDKRTAAVSVAPHAIDGAVDRLSVIDLHEGAGTVVNGLTRHRHLKDIGYLLDEPPTVQVTTA